MEGAARGNNRIEVAEREVMQRTNKESFRRRCQNVLEQLVEMLQEHLADIEQDDVGNTQTYTYRSSPVGGGNGDSRQQA